MKTKTCKNLPDTKLCFSSSFIRKIDQLRNIFCCRKMIKITEPSRHENSSFFFLFFFCLAFPRYLSKTTSTKDPRSRKNPCNRSRSTNWIRSNYPAGCRVFKGSLRIRAENFRQIDTRENTIGTPTVIERRWYRRKNDRDICRAHHILWLRFVLAIRSIGSR